MMIYFGGKLNTFISSHCNKNLHVCSIHFILGVRLWNSFIPSLQTEDWGSEKRINLHSCRIRVGSGPKQPTAEILPPTALSEVHSILALWLWRKNFQNVLRLFFQHVLPDNSLLITACVWITALECTDREHLTSSEMSSLVHSMSETRRRVKVNAD